MSDPIRSYRDLIAWQKAYAQGRAVHEQTRAFPSDERFGLTSQMRRSATSVPYNIAEGYGRGTTDSYVHFLRMARGSLFELETQMMYAKDFGYWSQDTFDEMHHNWREVDRLLQALIRSLGG
ncbi:MAG: four helix bundle protein [Phycisphaerales bacterium]